MRIALLAGLLLLMGDGSAATQETIAHVERMPRLPEPLAVRNWPAVAQDYYRRIFDPAASGDSLPCVQTHAGKPGFRMKSYLGQDFATEAMTCLGGVIGAQLAGLDMRRLYGVDWVERGKAWFDAEHGLYRHNPGDRSQVIHADIYGYWPAIQGTMFAALFPDDADFKRQAIAATTAFLRIARGLGCPDRPDFDVLGWDFAKGQAGGRNEPMNRLGHAPSVAWMLVVGAALGGDAEMIACARSALRWHLAHPGRYEISHMMGPLAVARLNALGGETLDLGAALRIWFGDGDTRRHPWRVTTGMRGDGGMTCDGLDGARWGDDGFYAFTMGTLHGPAWLVPVVRYEPRYARAIARYALHVANVARLLQGEGLDADHQDHAAWKARRDPGNLFFYEGMKSWDPTPERRWRPYATGDVVQLGWAKGHTKVEPKDYLAQRSAWFGATALNLSLYMGNQVGFLAGIMAPTDVPGILRWDCSATDWFHAPAYPTHLYGNPHDQLRTITLTLAKPADLYDAVSGRFLARRAASGHRLSLDADQAVVLVQVPPDAALVPRDGRLLADGVVIDLHREAPIR